MDIAWLIYSPWVFKLCRGTHYGYEFGFIILQTYEGSGQGFEQTRATVKSVQSVLCLKSCGLLKDTGVNSLDAVENATVNAGKYKSGFKELKCSWWNVIWAPRAEFYNTFKFQDARVTSSDGSHENLRAPHNAASYLFSSSWYVNNRLMLATSNLLHSNVLQAHRSG